MGKRNRTIRAERAEKQRQDFEGDDKGGACIQCGSDLDRETWCTDDLCDGCESIAGHKASQGGDDWGLGV